MLKIDLEEEDMKDIKKNLRVGQCMDIEAEYMQTIRACRLSETKLEAKIIRKTTNGEEHIVQTLIYEDEGGITKV